ncbi:hypothetical protein F4824DRAFT_440682, partial [Ustulina deusta]
MWFIVNPWKLSSITYTLCQALLAGSNSRPGYAMHLHLQIALAEACVSRALSPLEDEWRDVPPDFQRKETDPRMLTHWVEQTDPKKPASH